MSEQSGSSTATSGSASSGASRSHSALDSSQGSTTISDSVVSTIAGLAAKEIQGVHSLGGGGGAARTVGALRDRMPGARPNHSQGVSVEVGDKQAAVDVDVIIEYGVPIADVASAIRRNVINAVERMTGLQVTEVNISVEDVHLPEEDSDDGDSGDQSGSRSS
ncbi:Asp23/Gls24 family envelope stress response protein [Cellulomonas chengniuliangii]|uniref:Asp23/Gls24 family envelope stress response protein n=1 Tax=Cellulomonas chengniuliangii TaxID=2968084 RepID=A0ABY5L1W7_9CELL|nr:Asp23/Gls24 family envelope stress response protein [Cellulomonas chengniuliangii]MCC2309998.1 Asp23/Gls24 family envelope stress response protein [Cellulomonas chengniuliangii]MCC2317018.1 Asp23/Gls24 family envelope stress response protein [Cellulomonas chengniuliangii]UUI74603.1 Asp23/Gls24 family envelope stress response protein [Cellulomonas chengniuliangii]